MRSSVLVFIENFDSKLMQGGEDLAFCTNFGRCNSASGPEGSVILRLDELQEAAWPSGQSVGLAIRRSRVRVPLWPLAGFVLGRPEFIFSAALVKSQMVYSWGFYFYQYVLFVLSVSSLNGVPVN